MYYNTPFSLFPPNAAISLTDDNSTSFAARPAAFGPRVASYGLSGQLWVGSGFAEDSVDEEGELGCSDLPGWNGGKSRHVPKISKPSTILRDKISNRKSTHSKRGDGDMLLDRDNRKAIAESKLETAHTIDDGTDDYLHEGLSSPVARREPSVSSSHADIQSIQEAAEIEGKIVLLMRGGCGFLEKVMWAQRRGAVAVIVGDNQKGGPLIQMFAHGDEVENVTVPSVFTARTTAHLLSSLTQPGSFIEDTLDDNGNPVLKVQQGAKTHKNKQDPASTRTAASPMTTLGVPQGKRAVATKDRKPNSQPTQNRGWLARLFGWRQSSREFDATRPPNSGRLDRHLVSGEKDKTTKENMAKSKKEPPLADNFVIGVQDWRDPNLADKSRPGAQESSSTGIKSESKAKSGVDASKAYMKGDPSGPKGGSITPSSGEYSPVIAASKITKDATSSSSASDKAAHGFVSKIFGSHGNDEDTYTESAMISDQQEIDHLMMPHDPSFEPHEGLWVTITPTSSASPFFDTLLVLVVSPLVTLTVVYAMLIFRARIRRRRWRAPKSVVQSLPVRTFHTVAASPTPSSRLPSPSSTSPATPLLQQSPTRPRSRTTTGVLESENFRAPSTPVPAAPSASRTRGRNEREKGTGGFSAEWKKYMGRQVECVVCLEEYVDGVSRVMSLPCGHEFHEDCMQVFTVISA